MYYERLTDSRLTHGLEIKLTRRSGTEKTVCPKCGPGRTNKRDKSLSVNINSGEYNCHNNPCDFSGNVRTFDSSFASKKTYTKPDQNLIKNLARTEKLIQYFEEKRKISKATLEKFLVFSRDEFMPQTGKKERCVCFPYIRGAELINVKFRDGAKNFKMSSGAKQILFNLNSLAGKQRGVITEGEIDAMTVFDCGIGADWPPNERRDDNTGELINEPHPFTEYGCVSVPNGTSLGKDVALEYLDNCAEELMAIGDFVIATDDDLAGRTLRDELIRRLGIEKCRVVKYPTEKVVPQGDSFRTCKDLNEVKVYIGTEAVQRCIIDAEPVPIEGVFYLENIFLSMLENFRNGAPLGATTRIPVMDDFWRWKIGDVNLATGYGNAGKTTFTIFLMLLKSMYDGWKWGVFCPENFPANDFYDDLIEMYVGKWLNEMSEEEYVDACEFINEHFFYVYPDGDHDLLTIHERFRQLILQKGIKGILVDPFNQLDHNQKSFQREDQYLSETFKVQKRFALHNGLVYIIIAHPIKPTPEADKSYPVVTAYMVSGGSMWNNKMDNIFSYYRPNFHVDPNDGAVDVHILKIKRKRTGGKPTPASSPVSLSWILSKKHFVQLDGFDPANRNIVKSIIEKERLGLPLQRKAFGVQEFEGF